MCHYASDNRYIRRFLRESAPNLKAYSAPPDWQTPIAGFKGHGRVGTRKGEREKIGGEGDRGRKGMGRVEKKGKRRGRGGKISPRGQF